MARTVGKADGTKYVWVVTQYIMTVPRVERYVLVTQRKQGDDRIAVKVKRHGHVLWIRPAVGRKFCFSEDELRRILTERYEDKLRYGTAIIANAKMKLKLLGQKHGLDKLYDPVRPDDPLAGVTPILD